jgi:hypothetical protein
MSAEIPVALVRLRAMIVTVDEFEHDNFIIGLGDHQKQFARQNQHVISRRKKKKNKINNINH